MYTKILTPILTAFLLIASPGILLAATTDSSASQSSNAQTATNDGAVLNNLVIINKNEIQAAQVAIKKASHKSVKNYAHMMNKQHRKNLQDTLRLAKQGKINLISDDTSKTLQEDGTKEMSMLRGDNQNFDSAYIDQMITDHQGALKFLDQNIGDTSLSPKVMTHLKNTRTAVEKHLKMAMAVKEKLGKTN